MSSVLALLAVVSAIGACVLAFDAKSPDSGWLWTVVVILGLCSAVLCYLAVLSDHSKAAGVRHRAK